MKDKLQRCLHALEELNEASKGMNAICLPGEIDEAMEALTELIDKRPTCYIDADDLEHMKLPGCRLARVSNVSWDVYQVPLYRWV